MALSAPQYGDLVKFKEAISHFQDKIKLTSESYKDLQGLIHAKAITVAGAKEIEILNELYIAVDKAISDGEAISDFRKLFDKIVDDHGWSYKGKRGWRTQVIYQNKKIQREKQGAGNNRIDGLYITACRSSILGYALSAKWL
ncbi:hypothetical protein NQS96_06435 [Pseudoalteromonas shioyasakiensis]|uniref:phage head morphogenesis protein n=1 Tax=Pseudoalteromonas shioyasakiensis TaxID=1190813 RepID=UPI0021186C56|nr:hypothetical protein [Pseudoalteromonas shioyasakiensis]MCQ8881442.1 hypothetical protein [Pseudoalteromonas shioyasakiensis]